MRILTRYCLVEAHYETRSYGLHPCVHDWTLDGLNHKIGNLYWLTFDCVAAQIGDADWDHLSQIQYQRVTGHAKRLAHDRFLALGDQHDSIRTRLIPMSYLANLLCQQVQCNASERMYLRVLAGCEQILDLDQTSTLGTANDLGILYKNQGKLDAAEALYSRALAGYEQTLGPDHTSTLRVVDNLGALYKDQGKLDAAEVMHSRELAGYEQTLGSDHISTLRVVDNLGALYKN